MCNVCRDQDGRLGESEGLGRGRGDGALDDQGSLFRGFLFRED